MPHGIDVEPAAEFQLLGNVGQMHVKEQQVGDDLIPFVLEVVLRGPEAVVAQVIHHRDYLLHPVEDGAQVFVVETPVVDGCRPKAEIPQFNMSGV